MVTSMQATVAPVLALRWHIEKALFGELRGWVQIETPPVDAAALNKLVERVEILAR